MTSASNTSALNNNECDFNDTPGVEVVANTDTETDLPIDFGNIDEDEEYQAANVFNLRNGAIAFGASLLLAVSVFVGRSAAELNNKNNMVSNLSSAAGHKSTKTRAPKSSKMPKSTSVEEFSWVDLIGLPPFTATDYTTRLCDANTADTTDCGIYQYGSIEVGQFTGFADETPTSITAVFENGSTYSCGGFGARSAKVYFTKDPPCTYCTVLTPTAAREPSGCYYEIDVTLSDA
eukprot:CAMPEP_0113421994 /NCGR_PEP_ID=MMETSP0013_2-20120614/28212_1 /TAXON_ID=2843 ORGANISM="Skeletonema costatum, Strain 1716" /NCGR_SAMPLE_ID=MMETSP0013_2 /ASSEMBLY_ACC=CAM_ASM_000158 /LENGTH=233 /DNA_ID=CAMNT_0000309685 /DNA_START=125 /DNA_END=826 /DNA_ORIENTATION=+ /assembly_acc=CAM_ASM_000158